MKNISPLIKKAITAAKNKDWSSAVEINEEILKSDSHNIGALNRLALARMQLGHNRVAEKLLTKVLELSKHDKIALKNLDRVKKKIKGPDVSFNQNSVYIEEPGKAKVIELIRPAPTKVLSSLSIGQNCVLEPKSEYISIYAEEEIEGKKKRVYLGALPQSISNRLNKLIKNGNEYNCAVHSISQDSKRCKVLIKEAGVSDANQGITSFPVNQVTEEDLLSDLASDYPIQNDEDLASGLEDDEDESMFEKNDQNDDDLD